MYSTKFDKIWLEDNNLAYHGVIMQVQNDWREGSSGVGFASRHAVDEKLVSFDIWSGVKVRIKGVSCKRWERSS